MVKTAGSIERFVPGVISAIVLSVVTLVVFYRLQMYGPTSAIHRFNQAAAQWDTQGMSQVTVQRHYDRAAFQVATIAHNFALNSHQIRIVNLQQQGDQAIARVAYELPNGETSMMLYVLHESHGVWKIDLDQSMAALLKAMGYGLAQPRRLQQNRNFASKLSS